MSNCDECRAILIRMEARLNQLAGVEPPTRSAETSVSLDEAAREVAGARTPSSRSKATADFNRRYDAGQIG